MADLKASPRPSSSGSTTSANEELSREVGERHSSKSLENEPSPASSSSRRPTRDDFVSLKNLGEGSMGAVTKVMHRTSGNVYAMKAVDKKRVLDHNLQNQLVAEVKTQMTVKHPNLLRCYDYFEENDSVYIILELAVGGDLYQHLKRKGPLVEPDAAHVFSQVCEGVKHLHEHGIIHRDLKPENILLTGDMMVKIADFGWCAEASSRSTFCGTLCMLAPEMVSGKSYDHRVDVWAVGVLFYEMLTGTSPFDKGKGLMETCKAIIGPFEAVAIDQVPAQAVPLLRRLMEQKAEDRLPLADAISHEWVVQQRVLRRSSSKPVEDDIDKSITLCSVSDSSMRENRSNGLAQIAETPKDARIPNTSKDLSAAPLPKNFKGSDSSVKSREVTCLLPSSEELLREDNFSSLPLGKHISSSPMKDTSKTTPTATPTSGHSRVYNDDPGSPHSSTERSLRIPRCLTASGQRDSIGSTSSFGAGSTRTTSYSRVNFKEVESIETLEQTRSTQEERLSISTVASSRAASKASTSGRDRLIQVDIESPERTWHPSTSSRSPAQLPSRPNASPMAPPQTRLDLVGAVIPRTQPLVQRTLSTASSVKLKELDSQDTSSEDGSGNVVEDDALPEYTNKGKRWSRERLKRLDDSFQVIGIGSPPVKPQVAPGAESDVPRVFRPEHRGPAAKAPSPKSTPSTPGLSPKGSITGRPSSRSVASSNGGAAEASSFLIEQLASLGFSWQQATEASKRATSVEAAVGWLVENGD